MSDSEFENYVALIAKLLQLKRDERELIAGELQDHLQMRVADLTGDGMSKQDAISKALEEFGDAAVMAKNFQTVLNLKRRRWMMRFATFSIAGVFTVAILMMAMWPNEARFGTPDLSVAQDDPFGSPATNDDDPFGEPQVKNVAVNTGLPKGTIVSEFGQTPSATQRDENAEQVLEQNVTLQYDETPFGEVMGRLSEQTKLNFLLHQSALDDSLNEDEPVSVNLKDIPLSKGLEHMLAPKNSTYFIDHGMIVIVSRDDTELSDMQRIKMFDCKDLVAQLPKTASACSWGPGKGGGGGGGLFSVSSTQAGPIVQAPATNPDSSDEDSKILAKARALLAEHEAIVVAANAEKSGDLTLLNIVFDMVAPDSWMDNGGGDAHAEVVNGILIVRQTEKSLRDIDRLIKDLRANIIAE